jgi:hypothetical protein
VLGRLAGKQVLAVLDDPRRQRGDPAQRRLEVVRDDVSKRIQLGVRAGQLASLPLERLVGARALVHQRCEGEACHRDHAEEELEPEQRSVGVVAPGGTAAVQGAPHGEGRYRQHDGGGLSAAA